jgi:RimJ/RimL family protein N-acetyltransferase
VTLLQAPLQTLTTPRLTLRQWRASDVPPFAALNADPVAMEFMGGCLTRRQSADFARRAEAELARRGWGLWALELRAGGEFIGCAGLSVPTFAAHFMPCVEVGWRLARAHWGHGYATEAARECLRFAFTRLQLPEVVSFAAAGNVRSRAVMQRLGMRHDAQGEFEHPRLTPGDALRRHVLYRIGREDWRRAAAAE